MGKALMVARYRPVALTSGDEYNLIGYGSDSTTEANTQMSCTEAATFTNLGFRTVSGGSGTNTHRFRDAGAAGNLVAARAGVGAAEDTTNSDVLSAADLFNIAYTDTGSNSTNAWSKMNVEFSSGHGNFHGCASYGTTVSDIASSTRFVPLTNSIAVNDMMATEDTVEWKTYAYDSFEALQVRVTANARTNNSDFRNRINGANGTGLVRFGAAATGLLSDTAIGDAITSGQTVNASLTLGTGVEDLTIAFVVATLKSTTSKSEIMCGLPDGTGLVRAPRTPSYYTIGGAISSTLDTEANCRIKVGFAATVSNLRCYLSDNTYSVNGTLKLYQNGVAVITTTITLLGGAAWYENSTDTVTIDADDELSFEIDEGTTGSITIGSIGITFAPLAGAAIAAKTLNHLHKLHNA